MKKGQRQEANKIGQRQDKTEDLKQDKKNKQKAS